MPMTTASMMMAPRTACGSCENNGARKSIVSTTSTPVTSDASGVVAPERSFSELAERLVDTGMPCTSPEPTFAMPCASDS